MPLIKSNGFKAPPYLLNGHFETIYASAFRHVPPVSYERERIYTRDNDFLDLEDVIHHVVANCRYDQISFVGFSMGGSHVLKYLSTRAGNLPVNISRAVVFSVPCNLADSSHLLSRVSNRFYRNRFLKKLKRKIKAKHHQFPDRINLNLLKKVRDFEELDRNFTLAFLHLESLEELYAFGSVVHYMDQLQTPTLLVNAENDPMLTKSCYPFDIAYRNKYLYLEIPRRGGHVGFINGNHERIWSERRTLAFLDEENL